MESWDQTVFVVLAETHKTRAVKSFLNRPEAERYKADCIRHRNTYDNSVLKARARYGAKLLSELPERTKNGLLNSAKAGPDPDYDGGYVNYSVVRMRSIHPMRSVQKKDAPNERYHQQVAEAFISAPVENESAVPEQLQAWLKTQVDTLEFHEIDVSVHWLSLELLFKERTSDEVPLRLSITNENARELQSALTIYLDEVRNWRIRDLVNGITAATDEQIDQLSEILGLNKDEPKL